MTSPVQLLVVVLAQLLLVAEIAVLLKRSVRLQYLNLDVWIVAVFLWGSCAFISQYPLSAETSSYPTLIATFAVGRLLLLFRSLPIGQRLFYLRIIGFAVVALGVINVFGASQSEVAYYYKTHVRMSGLWANPNFFGGSMAFASIISFGMFADACCQKQASTWKPRLYAIVLAFFGGCFLVALVLSFSRGAIVAGLFGASYTIVNLRKIGVESSSRTRFAIVGCGVLSVCGSAMVLYLSGAVNGVWLRISEAGNLTDFSVLNRLTAWKAAFVMLSDHPLQGYGWGAFYPIAVAYYAPYAETSINAIVTNSFLEFGLALGAPSLVVLLSYIISSICPSPANCFGPVSDEVKSLRRVQAIFAGSALTAGSLFFMSGGMFSWSLGGYFWLFLNATRACEFHA